MNCTKMTMTAILAAAALMLPAAEIYKTAFVTGNVGKSVANDKNKTRYTFTPTISQIGNAETIEMKDGKLVFSTGAIVKGATTARFFPKDSKLAATLLGKKVSIKITIAAKVPVKLTLFFEGNVPPKADSDKHFWKAKKIDVTPESKTYEFVQTMPSKGVIKGMYVRLDYPEVENTYTITDVSMDTVE